MEDNSETLLRKLCCTCLCKDRVLTQLCRLRNGVNDLYSLLLYDSEACKDGFFKDSTSLYICWECVGILKKMRQFRRQACNAQRVLTSLVDGQIEINSLNYCLTTLCLTRLETISINNNVTDNFIDCGFDIDKMKYEHDDDIPLAELQNFYKETISSKIKIGSKQKKIKSKKESNSIDTTDHIAEDLNELSEVKKENCLPEKEYKCEGCDIIFIDEIEFGTHILNSHTEGDETMSIDDNNRYKCTECNQYFKNKNQRWKHVQRDHRQALKCSICGKQFSCKNHVTRHEKLHTLSHPRQLCPICNKMIRVDLFKVHSVIHTDRETFTCVECDKLFKNRASYENHLKYALAHAKSIQDIFRYKCPTCDKGYRSQGELKDHVNYQHIGKTRHKCPICGKALATRRCVTRHVARAHEGRRERALAQVCQACGKSFRDKKGLREHEFIHTGERPLSCEICGCTFRQKASLYTHRKRVHKIFVAKKTVELLEDNDDRKTIN